MEWCPLVREYILWDLLCPYSKTRIFKRVAVMDLFMREKIFEIAPV